MVVVATTCATGTGWRRRIVVSVVDCDTRDSGSSPTAYGIAMPIPKTPMVMPASAPSVARFEKRGPYRCSLTGVASFLGVARDRALC